MATSHTAVLAGTLLALLGLPCVLAVLLRSPGGSAERSPGRSCGPSDFPADLSATRKEALTGKRTARRSPVSGYRIARRMLRAGPTSPRSSKALTRRTMRRAFVLRGRADAPALGRLDHRLRAGEPIALVSHEPGIDQLTADLRRIHRLQRSGPAVGSVRWRDALGRAYDRRLELACDAVGVTQHLTQLGGMDRDIERVRMQGRLQESGLDLG